MKVGCSAPPRRDEGCAAPSKLLGLPGCHRCTIEAAGAASLLSMSQNCFHALLWLCSVVHCFAWLCSVVHCFARLCIDLLFCAHGRKIRSTVRIRCHGPIRRLCAGYAALHTADDAAEDEDAAAEPGCAALARLSVARYRLVDGPGCRTTSRRPPRLRPIAQAHLKTPATVVMQRSQSPTSVSLATSSRISSSVLKYLGGLNVRL